MVGFGTELEGIKLIIDDQTTQSDAELFAAANGVPLEQAEAILKNPNKVETQVWGYLPASEKIELASY